MAVQIPTLEFDEYRLRAFRESDVEALTELHSDPDIMRYLRADGMVETTQRQAWDYIALHMGHWALKGCGKWALARKADDQLIGRVGYFDPPFEWPGLELGWTVAKRYWGRGLAPKAARVALDWGMRNLRTNEIISAILKGNAASVRVAEKIGETKLRETTLHGKPCMIYGLSRSEWETKQAS